MGLLMRRLAGLSDLRLAIVLLLLVALASAIGTAIPQGDPPASYIDAYTKTPWLGLLNGDQVLQLQLDHVYSSGWFLALLAWLGLALILCSWRRQWPALQAARQWIDYNTPRQLSKLSIAVTVACENADDSLQRLASLLQSRGWQPNSRTGGWPLARTGRSRRPAVGAYRAGVADAGRCLGRPGRESPGAVPGLSRSLDLLSRLGDNQLTITLKDFTEGMPLAA